MSAAARVEGRAVALPLQWMLYLSAVHLHCLLVGMHVCAAIVLCWPGAVKARPARLS